MRVQQGLPCECCEVKDVPQKKRRTGMQADSDGGLGSDESAARAASASLHKVTRRVIEKRRMVTMWSKAKKGGLE